jgi:hypothetical protein
MNLRLPADVIPAPLWLVLFVIAGLILGFMVFFADSAEGPALRTLDRERGVIGDTRPPPCDARGSAIKS